MRRRRRRQWYQCLRREPWLRFSIDWRLLKLRSVIRLWREITRGEVPSSIGPIEAGLPCHGRLVNRIPRWRHRANHYKSTATPVILIHHHNIVSLHHSHSPINWSFSPGEVVGHRAGWANHCSKMHLVCCLRPSTKVQDEDGWVGEADLISQNGKRLGLNKWRNSLSGPVPSASLS